MTRQVLDAIVFEGIKFLLLNAEERSPPDEEDTSLGDEEEMSLLPKDDPRLLRVSDEDALRSNDLCFSTACWRGYIADWAVRNRRLYLAGITGMYRLADGLPILADWYSGVLTMAEDGPDLYSRVFFADVTHGVVGSTWTERDYPPLPGPE